MEQIELRALEDKCIQEYPPTCTATCPIHIDVRAMVAEIQRGDFSAALKILKKTLPFPGIISRICDHPCEQTCKRNEVGDPISIRALEQACLAYGTPPTEQPRRLPKRNKRVAVVGAGLSGLTAAYDLARKGYSLTIFEATHQLGGSVWLIDPEVLPADIIYNDLRIVTELGVEVRYQTAIEPADGLAELRREFDAVYVATGSQHPMFIDLTNNGSGTTLVDPVTFAVGSEGVFAGGGLLRTQAQSSPITSIADGRRAAISIDRYLQKVSLTASRLNEGSYTTRLYTNTDGIPALPVTPMRSPLAGYEPDQAVQEAGRCLHCECMECVKVCTYLEQYGGYPRQYLREIYNNLSIVSGERKRNQFINSCSMCGLCAEVCPENLGMGPVCKSARQTMVRQKRMPLSAHDFALRDMQFSNGDKFALARNQPGTATSDYLFFPGCQLSGSAPQQVEQVYSYLQERLGARIGLMLRCCGAPADWAGRADLVAESRSELLEQYQQMGNPQVVLACTSCYQIFKAQFPEMKLVSLWELYDQYGLPAQTASGQGSVAIHDPCGARYESAIQDSARNIVRQLGYTIDELALSREKTECCSYGGVMWLANRNLAQKVVERRIQASPQDYVTYCAMCRDFFAARGKRTLHLLDLIYGNQEQAAQEGVSFSQRHERRARLKRKLLSAVWGEAMADQEAYESVTLIMSDQIRERIEDRLILVEDIQQVIAYAERTGARFRNRETGHWLAYYKPTSVTYWVEYSPQDTGFVVHNAYSHRMELVEDKRT